MQIEVEDELNKNGHEFSIENNNEKSIIMVVGSDETVPSIPWVVTLYQLLKTFRYAQ